MDEATIRELNQLVQEYCDKKLAETIETPELVSVAG